MSFNFSPKIVTDGLVLYLDAANSKSYINGSSIWYDLSKNSYNGNLINGASFSSESNGCMIFDGVDDMIVTNFSTLNTSCSFEIWANRAESINIYNIMFGMFRPYFAFRSGNYLQFTNTIDSITSSTQSTGGLQNDTWYCFHFVNSYDGTNTTMSIYINGILVGSNIYFGQINTTPINSLVIGHYRQTPIDYPFKGKISNVKVYDKALSLNEINQNYNSTKNRYI